MEMFRACSARAIGPRLFCAVLLIDTNAVAARNDDPGDGDIGARTASERPPEGDAAGGASGPSSPPGKSESEPVKLKEIVVIGSRLPTAEAQTSQDVRIYDR